jgi:hypothetical protein
MCRTTIDGYFKIARHSGRQRIRGRKSTLKIAMDFRDFSESDPRLDTKWQYTHHTDQIQIRQSL